MPKKMIVKFIGPVQLGLSIEYDGQVFDLVSSEPYRRKDGSESALLTWQTMCKRCDNPVRFQIGNGFSPSRRHCDAHKFVIGEPR